MTTPETEMERFYREQLEALRLWRDEVVAVGAELLVAHYSPTPRWERFRRLLLAASRPARLSARIVLTTPPTPDTRTA